jgi:hypothetical protein
MDVDTIEPGVDFVETIEESVGSCDVLVAVIGNRWLTSSDREGERRINLPQDFVRLEIATALSRNVRVIPVLVDGASMPRATELPGELQLLVRRNALELSHNRFNADSERLITAIERALEKAKVEQEAGAPPAVESIAPQDGEAKPIIEAAKFEEIGPSLGGQKEGGPLPVSESEGGPSASSASPGERHKSEAFEGIGGGKAAPLPEPRGRAKTKQQQRGGSPVSEPWRAQLVASERLRRTLRIDLSHGSYVVEWKAFAYVNTITVDGMVVFKKFLLSFEPKFSFDISDGTQRCSAILELRQNLTLLAHGQLLEPTQCRLTVDGKVLYSEGTW